MKRWLRELAIAAAAALTVVGVHLLTSRMARESASRPPVGNHVEAALRRKVDRLRLFGTFPDALAQLQAAGVPISLDERVLAQCPSLALRVVDIELRNVPLEQSVSMLLMAARLDARLWPQLDPSGDNSADCRCTCTACL